MTYVHNHRTKIKKSSNLVLWETKKITEISMVDCWWFKRKHVKIINIVRNMLSITACFFEFLRLILNRRFNLFKVIVVLFLHSKLYQYNLKWFLSNVNKHVSFFSTEFFNNVFLNLQNFTREAFVLTIAIRAKHNCPQFELVKVWKVAEKLKVFNLCFWLNSEIYFMTQVMFEIVFKESHSIKERWRQNMETKHQCDWKFITMFVILFSRSFLLGKDSISFNGIINSPLYVDLKHRGQFLSMLMRSPFDVGFHVGFSCWSRGFIDLFRNFCKADRL